MSKLMMGVLAAAFTLATAGVNAATSQAEWCCCAMRQHPRLSPEQADACVRVENPHRSTSRPAVRAP
jgi:hypothetical protein